MTKAPCAFCGKESKHKGAMTFDGTYYRTPYYNCGTCGEYVLGERLSLENKDTKFRLACLTNERRLRGEKGLFGVFDDGFQPTSKTIDKHLVRW